MVTLTDRIWPFKSKRALRRAVVLVVGGIIALVLIVVVAVVVSKGNKDLPVIQEVRAKIFCGEYFDFACT
jgi:hypothetical protein